MKESDLISEALKLPSGKRELMVEALVGSLKRPSQRHLNALWAQEAESRVDGFLAGKIRSIPGEKVLSYRQSA